jgi:hypothetical protein
MLLYKLNLDWLYPVLMYANHTNSQFMKHCLH